MGNEKGLNLHLCLA